MEESLLLIKGISQLAALGRNDSYKLFAIDTTSAAARGTVAAMMSVGTKPKRGIATIEASMEPTADPQ